MPKYALLSPEEAQTAEAQGWGLHHVYDLQRQRWSVMVLGMPSAANATRNAITRANAGDKIALKAMQLISKFNTPEKPRRKK